MKIERKDKARLQRTLQGGGIAIPFGRKQNAIGCFLRRKGGVNIGLC